LCESVRVSGGAPDGALSTQGEPDLVVDDAGHVAIAWMTGPPINGMTFLSAASTDSARTFSSPAPVDPTLEMADVSMGLLKDGSLVMSALHKQSPDVWLYASVELYRSTDFGLHWSHTSTVDDSHVFDDRDWLTVDAQDRVNVSYSPRIAPPGGVCYGPTEPECDRPVYYTRSTDGGKTFSPRTLVNNVATRPPNTSGGFGYASAISTNGRIAVPVATTPNAATAGDAAENDSSGPLYLYVSSDDGASFGPPLLVSPAGSEPVASTGMVKSISRMRAAANGDLLMAWVGDAAGSNALYFRVLRAGMAALDAVVTVVRQPSGSLSLPTIATDHNGGVHLFWMAESAGGWRPMYSRSRNGGAIFASPQPVGAVTFPGNPWPGDFNAGVANAHDVFFAWAVAGGSQDGTYVTVARGAAD
jgi:hypothetical protein